MKNKTIKKNTLHEAVGRTYTSNSHNRRKFFEKSTTSPVRLNWNSCLRFTAVYQSFTT